MLPVYGLATTIQKIKALLPRRALGHFADLEEPILVKTLAVHDSPQDARGVAVAINGTFAAADVFDQARTLESVWPRLVTGYALDAISREADAGGSFSAKAAEVLLEHVGEIECKPCPSPGLGKDWRFEAEDVVAQAVLAKRICVHLSAFPNDETHRRAAMGPRIMPPSRPRR